MLTTREPVAPGETVRSLVKRCSVIVARLDSYLGLLGPQWHAAFGGDLALYTPLRFLAAVSSDQVRLRLRSAHVPSMCSWIAAAAPSGSRRSNCS